MKEKTMKTRAKVTCHSVTKRKFWGGPEFVYEAEFAPVTGGTEENDSFFASTPSGSIQLGTIREDHFEPGKDYYLDFTPCES